MIEISAHAVRRTLNQVFTISRGSRSHADTLVVSLKYQGRVGRGEGVPYARYDQTMEGEIAKLQALGACELDADPRDFLQSGAARNALDCALWDLRAKIEKRTVHELLGLEIPEHIRTAETLSLDTPENMAASAAKLSENSMIKIKLGGEGDLERLRAIRKARPKAHLIVDANEGWSEEIYHQLIPEFQKLGVEMIEQPFPAAQDSILQSLERPIPICADESAHLSEDVARLASLYDMVNIKLDKTGGLSEAVDMMRAAQSHNMPYMVGCMVGSSLAMAPAYMLTKAAAVVDLDGPLFMKDDEVPAIIYENGIMNAPSRKLWG